MVPQGIYRVNGVKTRVEKLCQAFENGKELVELSQASPHDISNVLKLYLRQVRPTWMDCGKGVARVEQGQDISVVGGSQRLQWMGPYCVFARNNGAGVCVGTGGVVLQMG